MNPTGTAPARPTGPLTMVGAMFRAWLRLGCTAAALAAAGALVAGAISAPARPKASACENLIQGTPASETLTGTPANDRILGLAGDDRLIGQSGDDCLDGGFDADELVGGPGDDRIEGSNGNDVIEGDAGKDELMGDRDVDRLDGGDGNDRLRGGGSTDFLRGGPGADVLRGEGGSDRLYGGAGGDTIEAGAGNDDIREVPDGYVAGESLDTGHNRIDAGAGRDRLDVANGRRDVVTCGSGKDTVKADRGDRLKGCERRRYRISPFPEVLPRRGGRKRAFLVEFRSLEDVSRNGESFSIEVSGPPGRGCGSLATSSLGMAYHRDRAVRYRLRPFARKGKKAKRWCRGRYTGKVSFVRDRACAGQPKPGGCAEEMPIGRFSFRVRG
jgi:hypothetical protein